MKKRPETVRSKQQPNKIEKTAVGRAGQARLRSGPPLRRCSANITDGV